MKVWQILIELSTCTWEMLKFSRTQKPVFSTKPTMKHNEFSSRIGSAFNDDADCGADDAADDM